MTAMVAVMMDLGVFDTVFASVTRENNTISVV